MGTVSFTSGSEDQLVSCAVCSCRHAEFSQLRLGDYRCAGAVSSISVQITVWSELTNSAFEGYDKPRRISSHAESPELASWFCHLYAKGSGGSEVWKCWRPL
jgi:hypothetical protein